MSGNENLPDRTPPTNGWGEWRYYVLEKLKDQQETIEQLRKENADLHLNMHVMREKKLEQRHEELKRKVQALKETADTIEETMNLFKEERREKKQGSRKLWLSIIQGFVAIILGVLSLLGKSCSKEDDQKQKSPAPAAAGSSEQGR